MPRKLLVRHAVVQIPRRPPHVCGHREDAPGTPVAANVEAASRPVTLNHASPRPLCADAIDIEWVTAGHSRGIASAARPIAAAFELHRRACSTSAASGASCQRSAQPKGPRIESAPARPRPIGSLGARAKATIAATVSATDTAAKRRRQVDVEAKRGTRGDRGTEPDRQRGMPIGVQ